MKYEVAISQTENGITSNAEQMKASVESYCKPFNYVVNEENYAQAKKDKAKLNKDIEEAKRKRIDFEDKILREWDPIKEKLMQVEKIAESYVKKLDEGIKGVDVNEKKNKKDSIITFFETIRGDLDIPITTVFHEQMLNKSYTEKQWKEEVQNTVDRIYMEYKELEFMAVEDKVLLKSLYTTTWNRFCLMEEYEKQMQLKKKARELAQKKEEGKASLPLPSFSTSIVSKTVSYMVSISGSRSSVEASLDRMRSLGLKVEVL